MANVKSLVTLGLDDVHVWRVELDQPAHVAAGLRETLDGDERRRAARFLGDQQRDRFVVAHGALRQLLGGYLGVRPAAVRFDRARHGKPFLAGGGPRFNLSHSGGRALIAVSAGRELGVDLERMRADRDLVGLAGRCFAPGERALLRALPAGERLHAFYRCWTRKEAYMKATGAGLALPLDSFEVAFAPSAPPALLASARGPDEPRRWRFAELDAGDGFAAAIAVEGRSQHVCERALALG